MAKYGFRGLDDEEPSGGGSGTVESVDAAGPASILDWSGGPVTTTGVLTAALKTQAAHYVWAGPTTGADAAPTFRALVAADIPALPYASNALTSAHILVGNGSNVATDVAMSGDATISNAGAITVSSVTGATNGTDAAAGKIGEVLTASGTSVSLVNNTAKTICSLSLPAGRWLIYGSLGVTGAVGTTTTYYEGGLSTTNNVLPSATDQFIEWGPASTGISIASSTIPIYLSVNSSTTVYLVCQSGFSGSTAVAFGKILAVRV